MWRLHLNSVCIVSHIPFYFCTYSAVRGHKQVILAVEVDIAEEYVIFTQPGVIFKRLV